MVVAVHHVHQRAGMAYQGLPYHLGGKDVPGLEGLLRILHLGIDSQDGNAMLPAEIQDMPPGIPVVGPFARIMDFGQEGFFLDAAGHVQIDPFLVLAVEHFQAQDDFPFVGELLEHGQDGALGMAQGVIVAVVDHVAGQGAPEQFGFVGNGLIGLKIAVVFAAVFRHERIGTQAALYLAEVLFVILPLNTEQLRAKPRHGPP